MNFRRNRPANLFINSLYPLAGLYIHIPFCKKACHYCNFHFATSLHYKERMVEALAQEIQLRKSYLNGEPVHTIYLGGGTPSLLSNQEIAGLLSVIQHTHGYSSDAEITLEANPDDITEGKLIAWKDIGINRLSIGVQSFQQPDLEWMNRAHTAAQSLLAIELSKKHLDNITIDLIYGLPALTDEQWKDNVQKALALEVDHLSCYALTVEPQTPLDKQIRLQQKMSVDPDKQSAQFLLLMEWMEQAGYRHYEISNFAKPGKESRHNSSYWRGDTYLGIGPSAHSYNGSSRQWNVSNNQRYIESIQQGEIPFEIEILTPTQQLNEYIMTALRTDEGVLLDRLGQQQNQFLINAAKFLATGLAVRTEQRIQLTREGKLLADGIAADLFFE